MRQPNSTPPIKQATSMNKLVLSSLLSSGSSTIAVWNGGIGRTNDEDVGGINDDDVGGSVTTDGVGLGGDVVTFCLGTQIRSFGEER